MLPAVRLVCLITVRVACIRPLQDTLRYAVMDNLNRFTEYIMIATEGVVRDARGS